MTHAIAVAQPIHRPDPAENLEAALELIRTAGAEGARLIAFPETWLPGYPAWLDVCRDAGLWDHAPAKMAYRRHFENSITIPGAETAALSAAARDASIIVVMGAVERGSSGGPGHGTLYNVQLTFGADGGLLNHHRKLMPTHTERLLWGVGDARGVRAIDTPIGRIGGLICWEHWMPLARQAMHEAGEQIHVAAWPQAKEMNLIASRHYAFEGRCFVIVAGGLMRASDLPAELEVDPRVLPRGEPWALHGGSCVIGPDGKYVVEPVYERECILYAELDPARITEESMALDVTGHYARPDVFRLTWV